MPRVDVVIATYNRPDRLERCLQALARQTYNDFGVIVIDDASERPAEQGISEAIRERLSVRVIRLEENRGPGRARNFGVAASTSDLIAFVDDDVVPDPELLTNHVTAYDGGDRDTIQFGPLAEPADWRPTPWNLWEARTLEHEYQRMQDGVYDPTWRQFFTGNAFVPRRIFQAAGGFDESFTRAEDIEFAYRATAAGAGIRFVPGAIGWHYAERSKQSWLRIARDYARFDITIDRIHPELGWQRIRDEERSSRNRASRLGFELLRRTHTETPGVLTVVGLAQAAFRLGLRRAALPLLSFAYSVEYERSYAASLVEPQTTTVAEPTPNVETNVA